MNDRAISMLQVLAAFQSFAPAIDRNAHDHVVLAGLLLELCSPRPSLTDMARVCNCGHNTIHARLKKWALIPWRDRHGWLDAIERYIKHELGSGRE